MAAGPPLDIVDGGTGASTAPVALLNLGVPLGTITGVAAGVGLVGGGVSGAASLDIAVPIPVLLGGTGAITAPAALVQLGAAPLSGPVFIGVAPRFTGVVPPLGTSTDQLATTAFVQQEIANMTGGGVFLPLVGGTLANPGDLSRPPLTVNDDRTAAITTDGSAISGASRSGFTAHDLYWGPGVNSNHIGGVIYDAVRGVVDVPPGSTVANAAGIGSYVRNRAATAITPVEHGNAVGFYAFMTNEAQNAHNWGINTNMVDGPHSSTVHTETGHAMIGWEAGFTVLSTDTVVQGIALVGSSLVQPKEAYAVSVGSLARPGAGIPIKWNVSFVSGGGDSNCALEVGAMENTGLNMPSQPIRFFYLGTAGQGGYYELAVNAVGELSVNRNIAAPGSTAPFFAVNGALRVAGDTHVEAGLITDGNINAGGDIDLYQVASPWSYIVRPNLAGYRNLGFAAEGNVPLDTIQLNSHVVNVPGALSVGDGLTVTGAITSQGTGAAIGWLDRSSNANWNWYADSGESRLFCSPTSLNTLTVDGAGNLTATGNVIGANFPSEARFKDHVNDYSRGLAAICGLRPVSWRWNGLAGIRDMHERVQYGVMADEAEIRLPEAIGVRQLMLDGKPEGVKTLDDKPILYALVNAVREVAERLAVIEKAVAGKLSWE